MKFELPADAFRNGANPLALQLCLMRMLDEIDYGILVVDPKGRIQHTNHLARHELHGGKIVFSHGNVLMGATT